METLTKDQIKKMIIDDIRKSQDCARKTGDEFSQTEMDSIAFGMVRAFRIMGLLKNHDSLLTEIYFALRGYEEVKI